MRPECLGGMLPSEAACHLHLVSPLLKPESFTLGNLPSGTRVDQSPCQVGPTGCSALMLSSLQASTLGPAGATSLGRASRGHTERLMPCPPVVTGPSGEPKGGRRMAEMDSLESRAVFACDLRGPGHQPTWLGSRPMCTRHHPHSRRWAARLPRRLDTEAAKVPHDVIRPEDMRDRQVFAPPSHHVEAAGARVLVVPRPALAFDPPWQHLRIAEPCRDSQHVAADRNLLATRPLSPMAGHRLACRHLRRRGRPRDLRLVLIVAGSRCELTDLGWHPSLLGRRVASSVAAQSCGRPG